MFFTTELPTKDTTTKTTENSENMTIRSSNVVF